MTLILSITFARTKEIEVLGWRENKVLGWKNNGVCDGKINGQEEHGENNRGPNTNPCGTPKFQWGQQTVESTWKTCEGSSGFKAVWILCCRSQAYDLHTIVRNYKTVI
ncbi:hypothetical protein J6590_008146 [Homalodisca vitripennis]|nr:hypothetical protein J6590_008146 [Homalodisca vitripennis]